MNVHALRISRDNTDLQEVFDDWAKVSGKLLVYRHDADEEVETTHCHFLIEECSIGTAEGLRKRVKHMGFKGNGDWAFTAPPENESQTQRYITYMTKGKLDPVYNKGYDPKYLEECKKKWVEYESTSAPKTKDIAVVDRKETALIQQWLEYRDYCMSYKDVKVTKHMELRDFRGMSIAYWKTKNKGLMPTASTYKRFLVSIYIYYCDTVGKPTSEQVIDEIDNRM